MPEFKFTSPSECAECGGSITEEIATGEGLAAVAFQVEEHHVTVPGLYSHGRCAIAVRVGIRQTRVTAGAALEYLADVFIPAVTAFMAVHDGDMREAASARLDEANRVGEILSLAYLLSLMEEAAEAEGCDPEDMAVMVVIEDEPHPRQMAAFN